MLLLKHGFGECSFTQSHVTSWYTMSLVGHAAPLHAPAHINKQANTSLPMDITHNHINKFTLCVKWRSTFVRNTEYFVIMCFWKILMLWLQTNIYCIVKVHQKVGRERERWHAAEGHRSDSNPGRCSSACGHCSPAELKWCWGWWVLEEKM